MAVRLPGCNTMPDLPFFFVEQGNGIVRLVIFVMCQLKRVSYAPNKGALALLALSLLHGMRNYPTPDEIS